jgi:hypothetical protein
MKKMSYTMYGVDRRRLDRRVVVTLLTVLLIIYTFLYPNRTVDAANRYKKPKPTTVESGWTVVHDGYGSVQLPGSDGSPAVLSPMASTQPDETHAALVRSVKTFGDFEFNVQLRTDEQLRTGSPPNPWEVGWILWHYTDDTHFYYIILKPNGWELGKEDPAYPGVQRFLATGSTPQFPIGQVYDIRIRQVYNQMIVWVNGTQLVTFTDKQQPYTNGALGLYTEDATASFWPGDVQ